MSLVLSPLFQETKQILVSKERCPKAFCSGEANANWNSDLYNCTFPALIDSWREEFSSQADTRPDAPFGFVQLSTIHGSHSTSTSVIRWHQTADQGLVPNDKMKNVFMAVAIDTYDEKNGIHPR